MSRWRSAAALVGLALAVAQPIASAGEQSAVSAGAEPLAPNVQPLRLPSPVLELPVVSLGGSVETTADRVTLQSDVLFAFGRARLGAAARSRVAAAVTAVRTHPRRALTVTGYTDAIGTDAANLVLSRRRAGAVARALRTALGSSAPPIRVAGRGEADPVASNTVDGRDDPRGRARNRRVELTFGS